MASVPGRLEKGILFAHLFADSNLLRPSSGLSLTEPCMELTGDSDPARRGTGSSWGSLGISGPSNVTAVLKGYIRTAPKGFSLFSKWELLRWAWMITKSISMPVWCHFKALCFLLLIAWTNLKNNNSNLLWLWSPKCLGWTALPWGYGKHSSIVRGPMGRLCWQLLPPSYLDYWTAFLNIYQPTTIFVICPFYLEPLPFYVMLRFSNDYSEKDVCQILPLMCQSCQPSSAVVGHFYSLAKKKKKKISYRCFSVWGFWKVTEAWNLS